MDLHDLVTVEVRTYAGEVLLGGDLSDSLLKVVVGALQAPRLHKIVRADCTTRNAKKARRLQRTNFAPTTSWWWKVTLPSVVSRVGGKLALLSGH